MLEVNPQGNIVFFLTELWEKVERSAITPWSKPEDVKINLLVGIHHECSVGNTSTGHACQDNWPILTPFFVIIRFSDQRQPS